MNTEHDRHPAYRSGLQVGLLLLVAMALGKFGWSFFYGDVSGGLAVSAPALVGLVVSNIVVLYALRKVRGKPAHR